jgi:hypothetical protein
MGVGIWVGGGLGTYTQLSDIWNQVLNKASQILSRHFYACSGF